MKYIIPEVPPSNNRYIGRENRWEYQAEKKAVGAANWVSLYSEAGKAFGTGNGDPAVSFSGQQEERPGQLQREDDSGRAGPCRNPERR